MRLWVPRRLWLGVALVACHHADAPAPAPPKGPTACARASDSIVGAMLARLPADAVPPTEEADGLRNLIRERCEHDGWSAEATQCLIAMTRVEDAEPCAKLMTEDQQAALVADQAARSSADKPGKPEGNPERKPEGKPEGKPGDDGAPGAPRDAGP
jgi:hypothetical protein